MGWFNVRTSSAVAGSSAAPSSGDPPFTSSGSAGPSTQRLATLPPDHPVPPGGFDAASADQCPVDHSTRAKWLAANSSGGSVAAGGPDDPSHPFRAGPRSWSGRLTPDDLSHDREISSIPRAAKSFPSPEGSIPYDAPAPASPSGGSPGHSSENGSDPSMYGSTGNWVYPSESQFFNAMMRKKHNPKAEDMKTIVPIHNAVNERAWRGVLEWERGMGGEKCGGVKLVSFEGKPNVRTPKAWLMGLAGYSAPFDRHDWLVDRCGTQVRYVIDFYSGKPDPSRPNNMAFHLDVRPALDNWDGIKTRVLGWFN